ncbi:rhodanese-like domain-containing protein [Sulfobacillus harzensis]|uniref:Rhodanese-like domain-containing protein n=1 Tax=Sulfobacillus harzensis TaxID=2729629 RepID=A0A7Y0Q2H8_9FIRM|nr:rhodanese-like domain-containing protein [Sulfobacillus harzensis]NMP21931.1 rhodanese-like domain-containing protein [Sulfobacillus harzensis]
MFGLGAKVPQISAKDLEGQLKQDRPPLVIDVRTIGEFRSGHIPGARLIPLGELGRRMDEIPKDQPVVTVCRSGSRSQMAAKQLKKAGYDVYNMAGGMMRWDGKTVR